MMRIARSSSSRATRVLLMHALLIALILLLTSTLGSAQSSPSETAENDDDEDVGFLMDDWYDEYDYDYDEYDESGDSKAEDDFDYDYDYDYDDDESGYDWFDYDDDWDWDNTTFIELDDSTDMEYFDDLTADEMCKLGNGTDANNSLADAFDAELYAEYCADTEFADVVDSTIFEVYKELNGTGFYKPENTSSLCADMPELDGCGSVATAPATNATAIGVIIDFINGATKGLKANESSVAKLFGGVTGRSLLKKVTNATLVNQTSGIKGDAYHLWAIRVTNPDDYFVKQRFGAAFVSGYVRGNPGYFSVHAKVSQIAALKDEPFPFFIDALPIPYQLRIEPFNAATCKLNSTNCHVLDVFVLGVTSLNQGTQISKTFKKGLAAEGHNVTVRVASSRKIIVKSLKGVKFDVNAIATYLAKQQKVERVTVGAQFAADGRPGNVHHYSGPGTDVSGTDGKTALYKLWADGVLAGNGQVVMLGDSGLRWQHCWYRDVDGKEPPFNSFDQSRRKLVAYGHNANSDRLPDGGDKADHGTHCAGLIAGAESSVTSQSSSGSVSVVQTGTAWKAKLSFYDIGKAGALSGIPDMAEVYLPFIKKSGAYVSSNSWGSSFDGNSYRHNTFSGYDSKSIDEWAIDNDEVLVLVANGNDGDYGLFSSGSPANCKNCLSVGSANADGALGAYSSRGPTIDGRIKPDVIGVGTKAISSDSRVNDDGGGGYCKTVEMTGTSMATPAVAGTLAVMRQYLTEGYYPTGEKVPSNAIAKPSAALLKAMIINGAEPLYQLRTYFGDLIPLGTVPSMYQGWGMARMDKTLAVKGADFFPSQLWDRQEIANGQTRTFDINFEPGAAGRELCVTLTWWDPITWLTTKKYLMNDLDLTVVVGGKVAFYPNGLGGPDRLNNVERTCLRTTGGGKGEYKIYVAGTKVTDGKQRFSLVVSSRSVKDRKKRNCNTDVCNDFKTPKGDKMFGVEGEKTYTIDAVTKNEWQNYGKPDWKYVELCEYTKKDDCAKQKACRWCTVGAAGRCHRKTHATAAMCPPKKSITTPAAPSKPSTPSTSKPSTPSTTAPAPAPAPSPSTTTTNAYCITTVKTNNCAGCAAMNGCNWCTFGDGRNACSRDVDAKGFVCASTPDKCPSSVVPGGIKVGLSPIAAISAIAASPPPPSPPPMTGTVTDKLKKAKEKLDAAKKLAEERRKLANEKKAAADAKKKAARDKIDELAKKVTDPKKKLQLKIIAGAKAAGVQMKKITAKLQATDAAAACTDMCAKSKVDCVNEVMCEAATTSSSGRHLLATASFDATLTVNPDVTKVDAEANLKAEGVTASATESIPNMNDLSGVLSTTDLAALETEVTASATAVQEATAAEKTAKAAETEVTAAEKEVTSVQTLISPPPPPPPLPPPSAKPATAPPPSAKPSASGAKGVGGYFSTVVVASAVVLAAVVLV